MMKLSVLLEAVDRVTAPVRRISQTVNRLGASLGLERLTRSASRVGTAFGGVAADASRMALRLTAAATIAGGGFIALMNHSTAAGDAAVKAAQRIGIGVEAYQRIAYAAEMAGSSPEELSQGVALFNKQVVAAARGNKAAATSFKRLGIDVKDLNGKVKPTEQLFSEVADKLAKMPDGANKTATAMQFFGRSGANLIPTLNLGAEGLKANADEAERLGRIIGGDTARASETWNDNLARLVSSLTGIVNAITAGLLPVLSPLIVRMTDWIASNRELTATTILNFVEELSSSVSALYHFLEPLISIMGSLVDFIGPANAALILFGGIIGGKMILSVTKLAIELFGLGRSLIFVAANTARLAFASVISMIGTFALALQTGTGVMGAFNAVLLANPIGAVVVAVAALAGAAYLIYQNWGSIVPWFGKLFGALGKIFGGFTEFIAGVFTLDFGRAWNGVKTVFQGWVDWFTTIFDGILGTVGALGSAVGRVAGFVGLGGDDAGGKARATGAAQVPVEQKIQAGGQLHIKIDSEGRPTVQSAVSDNPRVPLSVDAGMVMP
jgi:hypothetical protein